MPDHSGKHIRGGRPCQWGRCSADYGYAKEDFYGFIDEVPSAMSELVHWQNQGYALMQPRVLEREASIEAIR